MGLLIGVQGQAIAQPFVPGLKFLQLGSQFALLFLLLFQFAQQICIALLRNTARAAERQQEDGRNESCAHAWWSTNGRPEIRHHHRAIVHALLPQRTNR